LLQHFLQDSTTYLTQMIQGEPGVFIGPISTVLGAIINFFYFLWTSVFSTPVGALGFSIIMITIIVRTAMLPSSFSLIRNSMKMRAIKPELDKINEKYGNSRDPEVRSKKGREIQALNQKHGISMLSSCLPMLITWPLFMALFAVLNQAFLFVGNVGDVYSDLSYALIDLGPNFLRDVIHPLAIQRNPQGHVIDLLYASDMNRLIHVFSPEVWESVISQAPVHAQANLQYLLDTKNTVLSFVGLNLVTAAGWGWPGVLLPILSAGTMLLSQYLTTRTNPATDQQQRTMQKITMVIFPVMFGFFTATAPAGVGVYWIMLNLYMIVQHNFIVRYYAKKDANAADNRAA